MSPKRSAVCDTSVLVAALSAWHPAHDRALDAVSTRVSALPGHVLLECFSVLTRLPAPHRVSPAVAATALGDVRLDVLVLPPEKHAGLVASLATGGVRGGATYDGLVAAVARHHDRLLLTLDRRARATYDVVGATFEVL